MIHLKKTLRAAVLAAFALSAFGVAPAAAGNDAGALVPASAWAGAFAGLGRMDNRITDLEGWSNWGRPGWTVGYDDNGLAGGVLAGAGFDLGGVAARIELDAGFGRMSAGSDMLDPKPDPANRDETVESALRWTVAARAGIAHAIGPATLFAVAGPALARIDESVTDLDRGLTPDRRPTPWRLDPDDSFNSRATRMGWTAGLGVEAALGGAWALRLKASWFDFGKRDRVVNHSGDGRCGPVGPRRPCAYELETRLALVRLALVRRFAL